MSIINIYYCLLYCSRWYAWISSAHYLHGKIEYKSISMISVILRYKSYFEFEASANRNQCIIISVLGNTKWISTLKIKCITCIIWMAFRIVSNYCNDDNNGWIRNLLPLNIASSINFVCILKSMQNENQEPFAITFQQQTIGYIVSNHIYFDCTLVTEFIVFFPVTKEATRAVT